MSAPDFWDGLRRSTQARIGLGRAGDALPTARVLEFRAAHSAARDAVHAALDTAALAAALAERGLGEAAIVTSRARDRDEYLRRPDLGRLPGTELPSRPGAVLGRDDGRPHGDSTPGRPGGGPHRDPAGVSGDGRPPFADIAPGGDPDDASPGGEPPGEGADIGIVLADGLSALAVAEHGPDMFAALVAALPPALTVAPPVIATQARVALGDHIGQALGVSTVVVLIGERPGLSVADSLGLYLTHHPRPGRTDAERNCLSNIHPPEGLGYEQAARVTAALIEGARALGRSGVALKDTSREVAAQLDAAATGEL